MKKKYDISPDDLAHLLSDENGTPPTPDELRQTEEALILFAQAQAETPAPPLRNKILGKINSLNTQAAHRRQLDLANLPMLEEYDNWLDWEEAVKGIEPPADFENIHLHTLESNEKRELFIAWVKQEVPEEVHHDLLESFIILEGSCECHITAENGETRIVRMSQGDAITMQLGETHDIIITSLKPVKAILQWAKLAA